MKTAQMTITLAALFAMPATAQDKPLFEAKKDWIEWQLDAKDADLALMVIAYDATTLELDGKAVLSNGDVMLMDKRDKVFVLQLPKSDLIPSDLYVQAATYNSDQGLMIHKIDRIDSDEFEASTEDETPSSNEGPEPQQPLALTLKLKSAGAHLRLTARFSAPSDGFGLEPVRIVRSDRNTADVYLFRKLPNAERGEGMLDVVEQHQVKIDIYDATTVRVFLAEGTDWGVNADTAWELMDKLTRNNR